MTQDIPKLPSEIVTICNCDILYTNTQHIANRSKQPKHTLKARIYDAEAGGIALPLLILSQI